MKNKIRYFILVAASFFIYCEGETTVEETVINSNGTATIYEKTEIKGLPDIHSAKNINIKTVTLEDGTVVELSEE